MATYMDWKVWCNIKEYEQYETDRQNWERYGYYVHLELKQGEQTSANYHTHGILHSRGKSDFRIIDPIEPFLAASIFRELVERMDQGAEINPGQEIGDILSGLVLEISEASDESDMLTISLSEASLAGWLKLKW